MRFIYTNNFAEYMKLLKDKVLYANIIKRLERLSFGNFGDSKYIGDSLYELRIHFYLYARR